MRALLLALVVFAMVSLLVTVVVMRVGRAAARLRDAGVLHKPTDRKDHH